MPEIAMSCRLNHRTPFPRLSPFLAAACLAVAGTVWADANRFPLDFPLHPVTFGGAGGGKSRDERAGLRYVPVIMIPDLERDPRDWTGLHPGNAFPNDPAHVYRAFLEAGFQPIELWMLMPSPSGSLEEATDDLKYFIAAVMHYTGADKVQLLAHGTGCILARLTLLKYNLAHWVESEVYVAGPFHGISAPIPGQTLHGRPNAWWMVPGSELLREVLARGENPMFRHPADNRLFHLRTLTLRNGMPGGDILYADNPDSPALEGAINLRLPGLNHDALRSARAATDYYVPFLKRLARPYDAREDVDQDGFRSAALGGNDPDDSDPSVYPGAREIRGDGRDQDANGCDLAPEGGRDGEIPLPAWDRP